MVRGPRPAHSFTDDVDTVAHEEFGSHKQPMGEEGEARGEAIYKAAKWALESRGADHVKAWRELRIAVRKYEEARD